jgi:HJR/Mrr/RecB family endonuclease
MGLKEIIISLALTTVVFLFIKCRQIMRNQKLLLQRLKKSPPIQKQVEALVYFKGKGNYSFKDVRDSEVVRIIKELEGNYGFQNLGKSHVKLALSDLINGMNSAMKDSQPTYVERTSLLSVDKFSGIQFEHFFKSFFEKQGFRVRLTPESGDQGVDLILYDGSRSIAIQAKRYSEKTKVGNSVIQEVTTEKLFYGCNEAYVITTSSFTNQAITLANKVGVKLIDRSHLQQLLNGKLKL